MTRERNTKRCVYCGSRVQAIMNSARKEELTIFHKPGCKLAETKDKATGKSEAEKLYPHISHGGYIVAFS